MRRLVVQKKFIVTRRILVCNLRRFFNGGVPTSDSLQMHRTIPDESSPKNLERICE